MKYTNALICVAIGHACFLPAAWGQAADGDRDTVEVVGLRFGQTSSESGTAVSTISREEMERRGQVFVGDAVAAVPGVAVSQAGALGGVASVRLRGNTVGQTLVLIDGVPVNDAASPGGGYDFSSLTTFGVDRVEDLRGPQSTLWGADAIGGVISLVTETARDGVDWGGFGEVGSFGTWRTGGRIAGAADRVDGSLSLAAHSSDGISKADEANGNQEEDSFFSFNASGQGGVDLTDNVRVEAIGRWTATEIDLDGFPPPSFTLSDSDNRAENTEATVVGRLLANTFSDRLQNELSVSLSEIERVSFNGDTRTAMNEGERTNLRYSGELDVADGHRAMFGLEREETEADGEEAATDSVFGFYELAVTPDLVVTAGVRHDDDDRFGSETTGRAAVSWQANSALRLRATWGQGFKAPTLFQTNYICTFCGLTTPNRNLKAETSESFDLGADVDVGFGEVSVTAFDQDTENLIDFSFTQGYANIAFANQQGAEVSFDSAFAGPVQLYAAYTYIEAEDGAGNPLPRVPEHAGFAELRYQPDGPFGVSVTARYNGEQSDGFGPPVAEWVRTDLAASYKLSDQAEIYGRVENLFDEQYQQVGGYGTPGISGFLGIRVRN